MKQKALIYLLWPRNSQVLDSYLADGESRAIWAPTEFCTEEVKEIAARNNAAIGQLDRFPAEQIKAAEENAARVMDGVRPYLLSEQSDIAVPGQLDRTALAASFESEFLPALTSTTALIDNLDSIADTYFIELVVVNEDSSEFSRTTVNWAQARGIPTFLLTHGLGLPRNYGVDRPLCADRVGVFGMRGMDYFLDEGIDPARIELVGNPGWEKLHGLRSQRQECRLEMASRYGLDPEQPILVFATTWNAHLSAFDNRSYEKELRIVVDACRQLGEKFPGLQLVVKERWFFKDYGSKFFDSLVKDSGISRVAYTTEDGEKLLLAADVAVAFDSNFLVEAVLVGTPAVNVLSDFGQMVGPCFGPDMAVQEVLPEELSGEIGRILADPACRIELQRRMEAARPLLDAGPANGGAAHLVAECMRKMARAAQEPRPWQTLLDASSTEANQYHNWARRELFGLFSHSPRRVLDVGCGAGATGAAIKEAFPGAEVIGIELNRGAAKFAETRVDRVLVGRFEDFDLTKEGIEPGSIDTVIVADVLEHMYDPWHVLTGLKPYLSPDAQVIASLPNTRNLALLEDLAGQGRWRYASWGLLDITHIRFFTLAEIRRFFHETGYRVTAVGHNFDARLGEFYKKHQTGKVQDIEIGRMVLKGVTPDELVELCAFQFLVRAEPGALSDEQFEARETQQSDPYLNWRQGRGLTKVQGRLWEERLAAMATQPKVHLVVLVNELDFSRLSRTISSLGNQLYENFETTFIASTAAPQGWQDNERLHWLYAPEDRLATANTCLAASQADWVAVLDSGDTLAPHALLFLVEAADRHPDWKLIYSDEDRIGSDGRNSDPHFKPDFNLDLLRSFPYIGAAVLWRRDLFATLGGYDPRRLGAEDYDLLLRAAEKVGGEAIGHLADVLFHKASEGGRCSKPLAELAQLGSQAVEDHLSRLGIQATVEPGLFPTSQRIRYGVAAEAKVSILLPVKNDVAQVRRTVEALLASVDWPYWELLVLDVASDDPETLALLDGLEPLLAEHGGVWRLENPAPLADCYNLLAAEATGNVLVFLHFDCVAVQKDWLPVLVGHALRPEVGAVAPRLLTASGQVSQGGLVLGMDEGAASPFSGLTLDAPGYFGRALLEQDVSALPAGVLVTRKELFQAVGGLDGALPAGDAEADYCLRLGEGNFLSVWTPLVSFMSDGVALATAWGDATPADGESPLLARWPGRGGQDPAYNPNLSLREGQGFAIDPHAAINWDPLPWRPLPRILAAPADDMGCGQYRIFLPMRALVEAGKVQGSVENIYYYPSELARVGLDSIVFQRQTSDSQIEHMAKLARSLDVFKVFELDDLLIQLPGKSAHRAHMPEDVGERLQRALALCDRFVVSTEPLKVAYKGWCDDIRVVPNYLEGARWRDLKPSRNQGQKPRVGWVGGVGHTGDLEMIADVVVELAKEVEWVFMGMCPDALRPYIKEFHPGVPFDKYPAMMASLNLDLAVAPLEIHPFNEAKSHLRLLEYGVLGYPVVCSDIFPYQGDFPVKRVANRPREWISAIRERINDLPACHREGDILRKYILSNWLIEDHLDEWMAAWLPPSSL